MNSASMMIPPVLTKHALWNVSTAIDIARLGQHEGSPETPGRASAMHRRSRKHMRHNRPASHITWATRRCACESPVKSSARDNETIAKEQSHDCPVFSMRVTLLR